MRDQVSITKLAMPTHSAGELCFIRKAETTIHFDLAAYNCPEYKNITELKSFLMKRLEETTNRKPEKA